jgi:hypothetical protein
MGDGGVHISPRVPGVAPGTLSRIVTWLMICHVTTIDADLSISVSLWPSEV